MKLSKLALRAVPALIAGTACIVHIACGDASHVFAAREYVGARDCLDVTSSVDVVAGDDPGDCSPTCMLLPNDDAGDSVFVTTMCPPFPFGADTTGTDPACPKALAAFDRNDTCTSDGGSTHPAPVADAGSDAETKDAATSDAEAAAP